MDDEITKEDIEFILESLQYTKLRFEESDKHPTPKYKQQRIQKVDQIISKLRKLKNSFDEF